ncbi:hypothetical protein [Acidiferrobacter sp.]|uniref:hypothetical protein n=1 Tax=Acidiferrobacter sp. TaxID=1872107 RepID=UPI002619C962|nr:hypothetical protein [Acidiferrobacter sp.]
MRDLPRHAPAPGYRADTLRRVIEPPVTDTLFTRKAAQNGCRPLPAATDPAKTKDWVTCAAGAWDGSSATGSYATNVETNYQGSYTTYATDAEAHPNPLSTIMGIRVTLAIHALFMVQKHAHVRDRQQAGPAALLAAG